MEYAGTGNFLYGAGEGVQRLEEKRESFVRNVRLCQFVRPLTVLPHQYACIHLIDAIAHCRNIFL